MQPNPAMPEHPLALRPENRIGRLWRLRRRLAEQQTAANLREYLERMGITLTVAPTGDEDEDPRIASSN
jgi:hypothetical protein